MLDIWHHFFHVWLLPTCYKISCLCLGPLLGRDNNVWTILNSVMNQSATKIYSPRFHLENSHQFMIKITRILYLYHGFSKLYDMQIQKLSSISDFIIHTWPPVTNLNLTKIYIKWINASKSKFWSSLELFATIFVLHMVGR